MYKIFLLLTFLFSHLYSNNISWYSSYDKALADAKKEKKNMIIFIASSENKKSNNVLKKYFLNKPYIKYLNKNYINVLINIKYKTSYPIELFYTTTFPSIFFASYKDESFLTHPIYGFKEEDLVQFLRSIKSINQNLQ